MNYIRHLNGFFERLAEDKRLSSYHISLYIALFQHWNANRFSDQFTISRTEVMQLARIGSANTYARCMKELADWGYITYLPSSNLHSGSKVACLRFDMGSDIAGSAAGDTGIKSDTSASIAKDTASNTSTESDAASDTGTNIATETGTLGNLKTATGADTASDTSIKSDSPSDTAADTTCNTGINSDTENGTGRSTATGKNDSAGIKSDTGTDTASDTLFINNTNSLNKKESQSENNQIDDLAEKEKKQEQQETENDEDLPDQKFRIPDLVEVESLFEQNRFSREEARKFYAHYQSTNWKTGNKTRIVSWQAVARKWMNNAHENTNNEREFNKVGTGNLSVTVNKNYNEPL